MSLGFCGLSGEEKDTARMYILAEFLGRHFGAFGVRILPMATGVEVVFRARTECGEETRRITIGKDDGPEETAQKLLSGVYHRRWYEQQRESV